MQKMLTGYGLETKILRSFDGMTERSPTGDGLYPFQFDGRPGIKVILDRDYWILATWSKKKEDDTFGYIFNPRDGQSALNISIGESASEQTDAVLAQAPGFSFIGHGEGNVAGQPVVWRRWSDDNHIYSDCTVRVAGKEGNETRTYKMTVMISANSVTRRQELEACMPSLELLPSAKLPEAATPAPAAAPKPN
jgi:hypothetical protein